MTRTNGAPQDSWLKRLRTTAQAALFGYDFFISYRHSDASRCARSLHDKLQSKFDCFLDTLHYEAGHNLPRMQSYALKRARKLLVVVSPRAHLSPPNGTDWLLAEVKEFKHLAVSRREVAEIVPIGTLRTLSAESFPDSRLLPEIPTPASDDICIIDEALEHNAEVGAASIQKLTHDFKQIHRRRVRQIVSWIAVVAVVAATVFGVSATRSAFEAHRATQLEQALGLVARASGSAVGADGDSDPAASFRQSLHLFEDLDLDPILPLHGLFAERLHDLRVRDLAELDGLVGTLTVSTDGKWILVVYHYQAPNGAPDLESILDRTAFGVFHIPSAKWTLKQTLGTPVGRDVYGANLEEFLPPHHVTVWRGDVGDKRRIEKLSLLDGKREGVVLRENPPQPAVPSPADSQPSSTKARQFDLLSDDKLFEIPPRDGIDMEYGPRLVDKTEVTSPDGRTSIVGTYEGKLVLVDLTTGLSRGEMMTSAIFDAAFAPDSSRAYVANQRELLEVDTSGLPGVTEFQAPPMRSRRYDREKVLAAALSDDATVIALATTERLLARSVSGTNAWSEWALPKATAHAAALRVDQRRSRIDFVSSDDGSIVSVDYRAPQSPPTVTQRPGGPAPTVAWLDTTAPSVWIAATTWTNKGVQVHSLPLPGGQEKPLSIDISQPEPEKSGFSGLEGDTQIHALAKLGENILLFHGDTAYFSDEGRDLLHEQLLTVAVRGDTARNRVLFESERFMNGPDPSSQVTRVQSVLAGSTAERILVSTEFRGLYSIATGSGLSNRKNDQFLRLHRDHDHVYEISISGQDMDRWVTIRHERTGTTFRYQIPWGFSSKPEFASIAPGGRQLMLASDFGDVMLLDVSRP